MRARLITDATYRSQKVRTIQPPDWRPEYAWLIPIAEDNGVFEFDTQAIWAEAYGIARPDWNVAKVEQLLTELVRVGLIQRYTHEGKQFGCFTKAALPPPSKRVSRLPYPPGTPQVPHRYRPATVGVGSDYDFDRDLEGEGESDFDSGAKPSPNPLTHITKTEKTDDQHRQFKDGTPFPANWDSLPTADKKALLYAHRAKQETSAPVAASQDDATIPSYLERLED